MHTHVAALHCTVMGEVRYVSEKHKMSAVSVPLLLFCCYWLLLVVTCCYWLLLDVTIEQIA